jgi:hypothetical protein
VKRTWVVVGAVVVIGAVAWYIYQRQQKTKAQPVTLTV